MSLARIWNRFETALLELEDSGLTAFLIAFSILSFVVLPFVDFDSTGGRLFGLVYSVLFLAGCVIGDLPHFWRRIAFGLAIVGIILDWTPGIHDPGLLRTLSIALAICFMTLICYALLRQVFSPGRITSHRFRGATAAYLLLGFVFALTFVLLEQIEPGSLGGVSSETRNHLIRDAVYFSFVTLTTLGYGDITPLSQAARTLAVVEAIVGQLYLAMLIGRLISLADPRSSSSSSKEL